MECPGNLATTGIVMPLDFMWIKLSNDKALPFDVGATSVKVKVNLDVLSQR